MTIVLVTVMSVIAIALALASPDDADVFEAWVSSNLDNLSQRPVRVLILSALVPAGDATVVFLIALTACLAATETWLGHWQVLACYFGFNVTATVVTAGWILLAVQLGWYDAQAAGAEDFGVSYGLLGLWFLLIARPRALWGRLLIAGTGIIFVVQLDPFDFWLHDDFADIGHLTAAALGTAGAAVMLIRRQPTPPPAIPDAGTTPPRRAG